MAEMTPERIAEIRKREQQATKGPWEVAPCSDRDEIRNVVSEYQKVPGGAKANWIAELDASLDFGSDIEGELERLQADACFIAHARQDIPDLLDALSRAQQEIADLRSAARDVVEKAEDVLFFGPSDRLQEAIAKLATLDTRTPGV